MGAPRPRDDLPTTGMLQKKSMWFIGVEVEQETSVPPPRKNPGSAHAHGAPSESDVAPVSGLIE